MQRTSEVRTEAGEEQQVNAPTTTFPVFDWTGFTAKPPDSAGRSSVINRKPVGLIPGTGPCIAEDRAWRVNEGDTTSYSTENMQAWAKRAVDPSKGPVIFDSEPFQKYQDTASIKTSAAQMLRMVDDFREVHPKAIVGHYSGIPPRDWLWPVYGDYNGIRTRWLAVCDELRKSGPGRRRVTANVDFIAPDLYLLLPDSQDPIKSKAFRDEWARYTVRFLNGMLDEAKRYGKPVYPVFWPRLHGGGSGGLLWGRAVPDELLSIVFATIRARADGMFVWGGMEYIPTADGSEQYTGPVAWSTQEWFPRLAPFLE